jgi:hypothetical protein
VCKFSWPETPAGHDISADARDLVAQLLQRDPQKRLGMVGVCRHLSLAFEGGRPSV